MRRWRARARVYVCERGELPHPPDQRWTYPCGRVNYSSHGPLKVQTDSGERRGIMIESAAKGSALSSGGLDEAAQAAGV